MKPVLALQYNIFIYHSKEVLLFWIIYVNSVFFFMLSRASVYCCLLVTCWEMAKLLALIWDV